MDTGALNVVFLSRDRGLGQAFARALGEGFDLRTEWAASPDQVAEMFPNCDAILLDFRATTLQSEDEQLRMLQDLCSVREHPPILVLHATDNRDFVLRATASGAMDCIANPPNITELRILLQRATRVYQNERELQRLRAMTARNGQLHDLLGSSPAMLELFDMVTRVGPCDVNVTITGETGTGKELLARAIHRLSTRAQGPLVAFSCANLPESLVEDELFGHEKGAFTGAIQMRQGRIETANHGTLFLDEIGDMGLGLQPKLLRVLQEKSFERVGSNKSIALDVRVICATNQNLREMVSLGKFRDDLFYRLNVVELHLPPLRERRDDIALLAHHFVRKAAERFRKKELRIAAPAMQALEQYHWPGNVRELENVIQRAMVLSAEGAIEVSHLPSFLVGPTRASIAVPEPVEVEDFEDKELVAEESEELANSSYEDQMRQFRRNLVVRTLRQNGWRKAETARALGVARGYLHRLINQLGIKEEEELAGKGEIEPSALDGRKDTRSVVRMPDPKRAVM